MTKHQIFSGSQVKVFPEKPGSHNVVIVLTGGFSLLSLAALTDVLDTVGVVSARHKVQVRMLSVDGQVVRSRSKGMILPDGSLETETNLSQSDAVVLCSGPLLTCEERKAIIRIVRWCRRSAIPVCLIGAAVRAAAETGHLTKGTDHWSRIHSNSESLPDVEFQNAIFVEDGNLVTCCGELGAMDFALHWVSKRISSAVSAKIRNHLILSSARSADRTQTCTVSDTYKGAPAQLQKIIGVMMENLEEPLAISNVAHRAGLSIRQVERLFARYLSTSPVKFYRGKQYERARVLIEDTNMTVTEVALACGFSSFSAFGKGFRKQFGIAPAKLRLAQQSLQ